MRLLLGILVGFLVVRLLHRRRWGAGWHGWHRGCGGHGFGWRAGWHAGNGRRFFRMLRQLELDPRQRDELKEVWLSARRGFDDARYGRWRSLADLLQVATAEPLDRARLDELAARHAESQGTVARGIAAAVARAHEILRPEQRAKLRELIERAGLWRFERGEGTPPGDGPYRQSL